jgi:hypothetical protein
LAYDIVNDNIGAFFGKGQYSSFPDTFTRARNKHNLTFQIKIHCPETSKLVKETIDNSAYKEKCFFPNPSSDQSKKHAS